MQLSLKALFSHFRLLGLPDYLSDDPFHACAPPLLPQRLTPCHIHHSRTVDLQQKSPQRSYFHCGCTACQIWLPLPQRPVGICKNESFPFFPLFFLLPLYRITKNSHLGLSVGQAYPAGPTRSLISDLRDRGAVRPLLASVKAVWKLYSFSIVKPEE